MIKSDFVHWAMRLKKGLESILVIFKYKAQMGRGIVLDFLRETWTFRRTIFVATCHFPDNVGKNSVEQSNRFHHDTEFDTLIQGFHLKLYIS